MAEWEKHLSYKHQGRPLDSQYPHKCQVDVAAHLESQHWGDRDWGIGGIIAKSISVFK